VPRELKVTAKTWEEEIMAVEHRHLPVWGVQFHPESILTASGNVGAAIIANVLRLCRARTSLERSL